MTRPPSPTGIIADDWQALRRHTPARIALGRSGASLPTAEVLAFRAAHARARDAVHLPLDVPRLVEQLKRDGLEPLNVRSRALDRAAYLARPDWGRRVRPEDLAALDAAAQPHTDIVFVISDGLSSTGVQAHAAALLRATLPQLHGLRIAPPVIATQARVALADEVGERLGARLAVSVIGERPGLSSPDSLGLYVTFAPRVGATDERRNCISNVRPAGLDIPSAALLLASLLRAALRARLSGVALRFDPGRALEPGDAPRASAEDTDPPP